MTGEGVPDYPPHCSVAHCRRPAPALLLMPTFELRGIPAEPPSPKRSPWLPRPRRDPHGRPLRVAAREGRSRRARVPRGRERFGRRVDERHQDLQDALYAEMLSRIQQTDLSVPHRRGEWFYHHAQRKVKAGFLLPQAVRTAPSRSARRERAGRGPLHGDRRLSEPGRLAAGVQHGLERLPPVPAPREGPEHGRTARRDRRARSSVASDADGRTLFYAQEDAV